MPPPLRPVYLSLLQFIWHPRTLLGVLVLSSYSFVNLGGVRLGCGEDSKYKDLGLRLVALYS